MTLITPVVATEQPVAAVIDPKRFCSVCNISVSSESQMLSHLEGIKHAKKLKALNMPPYVKPGDTILAALNNIIATKPPIIVHHNPPAVLAQKTATVQVPPKIDISIYRTPSGSFYCSSCNMTVTDENNFQVHLNSQNHFKKSVPAHKDSGRK